MNLRLDELIRRFLRGEELRETGTPGAGNDVRRMAGDATEIGAILSGDLRQLHDLGAHPLLIMQLAGALGIDPAAKLRNAESQVSARHGGAIR